MGLAFAFDLRLERTAFLVLTFAEGMKIIYCNLQFKNEKIIQYAKIKDQ